MHVFCMPQSNARRMGLCFYFCVAPKYGSYSLRYKPPQTKNARHLVGNKNKQKLRSRQTSIAHVFQYSREVSKTRLRTVWLLSKVDVRSWNQHVACRGSPPRALWRPLRAFDRQRSRVQSISCVGSYDARPYLYWTTQEDNNLFALTFKHVRVLFHVWYEYIYVRNVYLN